MLAKNGIQFSTKFRPFCQSKLYLQKNIFKLNSQHWTCLFILQNYIDVFHVYEYVYIIFSLKKQVCYEIRKDYFKFVSNITYGPALFEVERLVQNKKTAATLNSLISLTLFQCNACYTSGIRSAPGVPYKKKGWSCLQR